MTSPVDVTVSENVTLMFIISSALYAPFALVEVISEIVGALVSAIPVSIMISLFAARFVAGTKSVIALPAGSATVPAIEVTVRSPEASPFCTL